jgi:hypothetical protein
MLGDGSPAGVQLGERLMVWLVGHESPHLHARVACLRSLCAAKQKSANKRQRRFELPRPDRPCGASGRTPELSQLDIRSLQLIPRRGIPYWGVGANWATANAAMP